MDQTVIIGAGPAGLTAAWELRRLGRRSVVLESGPTVGGIARTGSHRGYRYDLGGHRFFTKSPVIQGIWEELLGEELLVRPRLSRIYYDGVFFDYPLRPINALRGLGIVEAMRCGFSFARAKLLPHPQPDTFDQWVTNRFGRRLFEIFFESYTEKVWGMPCSEIEADWAAQRIKNLDLAAAVWTAVRGARAGEVIPSLIERFHYPRLGPGQMWEAARDRLAESGTPTRVEATVVAVEHDGERVRGLCVDHRGHREIVAASSVISSMPLGDLVEAMEPPAPAEVRAAAARLRYRDFLTVLLVVRRADLFPDNWIYVHSPSVRLGRVQNFGNWSESMVPIAGTSALGLEYFVNQDEALWASSDASLIALGTRECAALGLIDAADVIDGCVVRVPKAYPVYDRGYKEAIEVIRGWLGRLRNLESIGRNGQHRYNNQDHSMMTGLLAARNVVDGGGRDVWGVNLTDEYHEAGGVPAGGDRMVPQRIQR